MTGMSVVVTSDQKHKTPITIFEITGEIDVNTYEQLQELANQAIDSGTRYLLLDLAAVSYISSSGLRALHHIFTRLHAGESAESNAAMRKTVRDGSFKSPYLKLLNPQPPVLDVLKMTGFDMYLPVYREREKALADFG